ncbi:MAG: hypothetical protein V9F04_15770 [Dermatophilaceae bacterium]
MTHSSVVSRVTTSTRSRLRGDDCVEILVCRGDLVDDAGVLAALDARGLGGEVGRCERACARRCGDIRRPAPCEAEQ